MRPWLALSLALLLAAGSPARADGHVVTPIGVRARRARAEIVAGAVLTALGAVAAVVSIAALSAALSECSTKKDCGALPPVSLMSGLAALVESVVGVPLLAHGLVLRNRTRLLIAPVVGAHTVGGGIGFRF